MLHKKFRDCLWGMSYYLSLAEQAEESGKFIRAQKLLNIAKDNFNNGVAILKEMGQSGIELSDGDKAKWDLIVTRLWEYVR